MSQTKKVKKNDIKAANEEKFFGLNNEEVLDLKKDSNSETYQVMCYKLTI